MSPEHIQDFTPRLEKAIALARAAGLSEAADELEGKAFAACATSSEFLGQAGQAIARFRKQAAGRIPQEADLLLGECLREISKAWSPFQDSWPRLPSFLARWLKRR